MGQREAFDSGTKFVQQTQPTATGQGFETALVRNSKEIGVLLPQKNKGVPHA